MKDLIRRIVARMELEPVMVLGIVISLVTILRDQLDGGANLETALTTMIVVGGSKIVREVVWPAIKVEAATGAEKVELEDPITGTED